MDQSPSIRRATPRPTFTGPTVLRRSEVAHHVWGDATSGLVTDRVYVSSQALHVLEFELGPGGCFRHSPSNKTIFAADVVYCVLEGELVIADPQHGEVEVVPAGECVLFRRDTWHHGFNPGAETLRVLEFFAPPPSQGTASGYSVHQPDLPSLRYHDDRWTRQWPELRAKREQSRSLHRLPDSSALWSFAAASPSHLLGTLVDTEHLTVVRGRLQPGHVEDHLPLDDESLLVVTSGELWADVQASAGEEFLAHCLVAGDAVYVPRGRHLRLLVRAGAPASYLRGSGRPVEAGWKP